MTFQPDQSQRTDYWLFENYHTKFCKLVEVGFDWVSNATLRFFESS